jgi:hypothetical protein
MNEIGRHGRQLLDDARRERTPDTATRERVFAALMEDTEVTKLAKAVKPGRETKPLTPVGKCLVLLGLVAAVAAGVYAASHVGAKPPPTPTPSRSFAE